MKDFFHIFTLRPVTTHRNLWRFMNSFILVCSMLFLSVFSIFGNNTQPEPLVVNNQQADFFISGKHIAFFEDNEGAYTIEQVVANERNLFVQSTEQNLSNQHTSSSYWLYCVVVNHSSQSHFRIELYDFDIDELSFYTPLKQGSFREETTGFSYPFNTRTVHHKNPGFDVNIAPKDSLDVYLKIKSSQVNILTPVIRHYQGFVAYGLREYLLLGIFNGLMLLILIYNLVYFLLLRASHYLYYVFYGLSMLVYLNTQNGIGFQFLWPNNPHINTYVDSVSLSLSIIFLLLFCNAYLGLKAYFSKASLLVCMAIILKLVLFTLQLIFDYELFFNVVDFLFFQLCFALGCVVYRSYFVKIRWYIVSFLALNISVLVFLCEHYDWVNSNVFTVYSLNFGVLLQFVFLSIGIAESISDSYKEKNVALTELLLMKEKNESLRLTELKQQMNPHFLFNALNSIQSRILTDKKEEASKFLIAFSKLIRKNLEISELDFISLEEELHNSTLYLDIENMRLGDSFRYTFYVDETVDLADVKIPTFILQPLIENAIWHGLMPLETEKILKIEVLKTGDVLSIRVCDNGIGRAKSLALKSVATHTSKGLKLINERIELISHKFKKKISLEIFDIERENETGTEALLTIEL